MKNRTELAEYFAELGFKTGAEIGVQGGRYSDVLLKKIPGLKLYSIDVWEAKYKVYEERARKLLSQHPGSVIIKNWSIEAAKDFADNSLDFVYIDANHWYESVKQDLETWTPKVRPGGIVSGHDYVFNKRTVQVTRAVDEFVQLNNYKLYLTDYDGNAEMRDDRLPSWFFVK